MATFRSGRDLLPPSHPAVRHDLTHPSTPAAAFATLRNRLRIAMGEEASKRVKFLPSLEAAFAGLRGSVVAVLDPFPVGLHLPLLEALIDGVPVVSLKILLSFIYNKYIKYTYNPDINYKIIVKVIYLI